LQQQRRPSLIPRAKRKARNDAVRACKGFKHSALEIRALESSATLRP
jgi:hypothetical protein